jgi:hypothetical protein
MSKIYIGIDNGTTGTIGIAGDDIMAQILHTPVKKEQDYTKAKKNVSRLDVSAFMGILNQFDHNDICVVCERPMINPTRWTASMTAIRCWEAQLVVLEVLGLPHLFVDSKEWQRMMLPKGVSGANELKKASKDIGNRLFPYLSDFKHTDFDGLLIAEFARRKRL